jgi:predicted alpha/beta-fold hydrolase
VNSRSGRFDPPRFRPAPGLGNPHVQTLAGKLLRPAVEVPLRRERLETSDGDFLDLDFAGGDDRWSAAGPLAVVLHGLEGNSRRRYMRTTFAALLRRGVRPVGLNFRGCSGEPNRTARAYHSGETGDLREVLEWLRDRWGGPMGLVGYSLGGNVVLKLAGESGAAASSAGVEAVAAVSVPFDLAAGARALEAGLMGRLVYTRYFMGGLRSRTVAKGDLVEGLCDLEAVRRARTIREFDDAATAPIFGFESAADYYDRSSSARFIDGIRVPTLVVHSRDDPFLPARAIPEAALEANPAITPVLTDRGGHQGYVAGSILRPEFWVEEVVADWMADHLAT